MNKTKDVSKYFIIFGIYSSLVLAAVGSVAGTYAWFTYSGHIESHFHGTALDKSNSLKVGLVSTKELPEASNYGLTKDADSNIYWSDEGISPEALSYFFTASGYAGGGASENQAHPLVPVTSGAYETNGDFSLKARPGLLKHNYDEAAQKEHYLALPLVFDAKNRNDEHFNNFEVRLTGVELRDADNGSLSQTIRIHIDNQNGENFIFNPNTNRNGSEKVGGTLDLDRNGYIDLDYDNKEFIYGECDHINFSTTPHEGDEVRPLVDRTPFNGVHKQGAYIAQPDSTSYKTTSYLGKASVLSKKNVASIKDDHYAYTTLTIYEEGWCENATEKVINDVFDLSLTFELFNAE